MGRVTDPLSCSAQAYGRQGWPVADDHQVGAADPVPVRYTHAGARRR
jgi:hypothetical protein